MSNCTANELDIKAAEQEYNQICSDENWIIPYMPDASYEKTQQIVNAMQFYRIYRCDTLRKNLKYLKTYKNKNIIKSINEFNPFN